MRIQEIHFIREVLATDFHDKESAVMEVSHANASYSHPNFREVAFYEVDEVRALYIKLGGGRREGDKRGSTVIIPNRSRKTNLWGISASEVRVVDSMDSQERWESLANLHTEQARARNRLMRD